MSAYAVMYEELFGTPIDQIVIIKQVKMVQVSIRKEQSRLSN